MASRKRKFFVIKYKIRRINYHEIYYRIVQIRKIEFFEISNFALKKLFVLFWCLDDPVNHHIHFAHVFYGHFAKYFAKEKRVLPNGYSISIQYNLKYLAK